MRTNKSNSLWTEKYRPTTVDDLVGDPTFKDDMRKWIASGDVPHLLLIGKAGTGKTTIARILAGSLDCDALYVNASDKGNIDFIRTDIIPFASSVGFNDLKVVVLDEADYISVNAQAALRNVMETSSATTRFILTCNYADKILDPIASRCQVHTIVPPTKGDVFFRLKDIAEAEGVAFDGGDLTAIVDRTYPDVRRAVQLLQKFSSTGALVLRDDTAGDSALHEQVAEVLLGQLPAKAKFVEARKLLVQMNDYNELYRHLYDQSERFPSQAAAILAIAEAQYQDAFVVDHEINAAALAVKLIKQLT